MAWPLRQGQQPTPQLQALSPGAKPRPKAQILGKVHLGQGHLGHGHLGQDQAASQRRNRGRLKPITLLKHPSIRSTTWPPMPSRAKPPAHCNGSPVAT